MILIFKYFKIDNLIYMFIVLCIFSLLYTLYDITILKNIIERLFQLGSDIRSSLNTKTFISSFNSFFIGHGSDAVVNFYNFEKRPHNFLLGSFLQAGILGLIFSFIFMFVLFRFFILNLIGIKSLKHTILLLLLLLPLFRMQISGESGSLTYIEWFCISMTLAYFINIKNKKKFNFIFA